MKTIERILCPVDFSDSADAAVDYALDVARQTGAALVLLHAYDGREAAQTDQFQRQLAATATGAPDVKIERVLHAGQAGEVICWSAEQRRCNLIVMGTHGSTALKHLVVGSVTDYVLRHAR